MNMRYEHRAKKRFGQHFLSDSTILDQIVAAIAPRDNDAIIEIGPGPAVLTDKIAHAVRTLKLIEIDRDWAQVLRKKYQDMPQVELINQDVLTVVWGQITSDTPWRVVGNLPYNISTPLLFSLFEQPNLFIDMHFVLQNEVVQRITAAVGSSHYGRLSVMCQYHCRAQSLLFIPPEAFDPPPKVNSALIRLVPHITPPVVANSLETLSQIVKEAFTFRRKTLSNGLKKYFTTAEMTDLGIDPKKRPQELSVAEYVALANAK